MATIKVACPECGQRVSGDETFLGKTVDCPICQAVIRFPDEEEDASPPANEKGGRGGEDSKGGEGAAVEPEPGEDKKEKDSPEKKETAEGGKEQKEQTRAKVPKLHRASAPVMPVPSAAAKRSRRDRGPQAPERTSSAAIWSLICGITSLLLCPVGLLFAIPAVVIGHAGRGNIDRSMGKLGGYSLTSVGLMLGYVYLIGLFLIVILDVWRPFVTFGLQRFDAQCAGKIHSALVEYAEANEGKFPPQLEDLSPDFLAPEELETLKWVNPYSKFPMIVRAAFVYHEGHTTGDDPGTILLSAPDRDPAEQRLVCRINGVIENLAEEEFIRLEGNQ